MCALTEKGLIATKSHAQKRVLGISRTLGLLSVTLAAGIARSLPAAAASPPPMIKIPPDIPPTQEDTVRDLFDFRLGNEGNIAAPVDYSLSP